MIAYVVLKNCKNECDTQFNIFKGVYTDLRKAYDECARLCKRDYYILARYPKETYKNVKHYEDVIFNSSESCIVATAEGHIIERGYTSIEYHIRKVII